MDTHTPYNCNDIARLALAMHGHSYFFSLRRHLNINFSRDLNGSGTQGLFIKKQNVDIDLIGYTDLMVDGAPSPHQSDTTLRWLIDRLRS